MNYDHDGQGAGQKKEGMKVLVVEPLKAPYLKTISGDLRSLQKEVQGSIDATYPFDDMVAIVLNDEGKLNDMMPNRGLYDDEGNLYDIIFGPLLVTGLDEESFITLSDELAEKYMEKYKASEMLTCINGEPVMVPIIEESGEKTAQADKESKSENSRSMGKERNRLENNNRKIRKRNRKNEER